MSNQEQITTYHQNAKNAGNRLPAYVTNSCIGAVAVFFLALVDHEQTYSTLEKTMLIIALLGFVFATLARFLELHFDARRFYQLAMQTDSHEDDQDWAQYETFKKYRMTALWISYSLFAIGITASVVFLIARVW